MRRQLRHGLRCAALLFLVATGAAVSGCGSSESLSVSEGEQVKLGELTYNVQLSRFLNPNDNEDRFYLTGQKPLPADKFFFGVFIQVKNPSDKTQAIPREFTIEDTLKNSYRPVPSKSNFALDLGGSLAPQDSAPGPDTPAQSGPTQGSLILFVVNSDITENRPLHMLVPGPAGEHGTIKLDI